MIRRLTRDNIILGPLVTTDSAIELYTKWVNDEEIAHWIDKNASVITIEQERKWATTDNGEIRFTIGLIDEMSSINTYIGTCSITLSRCNTNATLGILIGNKDFRSKGIGTKVIEMLTDYAFNELRVHRCYIVAVEENERAVKCYQKAGYTICGIEHEAFWYHRHYANIVHLEKIG